MVLPLSGLSSDSLFNLQSASLNTKIPAISANNVGSSNSSYYAKEGEPMYMQEMDADEDGIISLDEFRDYCGENNISTKQMVKMVEMANNYRTMKANENAFHPVQKNENSNNSIQNIDFNPTSENVYARRGDSKYDEAMDSNSDDKITYEEYIEYCKEHAKPEEKKADTKLEQTENGTFKTTSFSKAINAYAKAESAPPEGKYEKFA